MVHVHLLDSVAANVARIGTESIPKYCVGGGVSCRENQLWELEDIVLGWIRPAAAIAVRNGGLGNCSGVLQGPRIV